MALTPAETLEKFWKDGHFKIHRKSKDIKSKALDEEGCTYTGKFYSRDLPS